MSKNKDDNNFIEELRENERFHLFECDILELKRWFLEQKFNFSDTLEAKFTNEMFLRILDESLGYIGCLKQRAFLSAKHHTRALMELYASIYWIVQDRLKNKHYLKRYMRFPEIELYKILRSDDRALFVFSEGVKDLFSPKYKSLDPELMTIFGKKTEEDLLKMDTWRGNCTINNLLEKLPDKEGHIKNYEILCHYAHISPLAKCYEEKLMALYIRRFPKFHDRDTEILEMTIKYNFNSCEILSGKSFLDGEDQKTVETFFKGLRAGRVYKS